MLELETKKEIDFFLGTISLLVLKPLVRVFGRLLRRDHDISSSGDFLFIKMLGGGSLVIAYPSLLGLRRRYPGARFRILCTPSVRPFAILLGIFDEVVEIDDSSLGRIAFSGVLALKKCFGVDTCIDLEAHSRLTTVFSLLTAARNRITFFIEDVRIRDRIGTHLIFFNQFAGTYSCYDNVACLLDAEVVDMVEVRKQFLQYLGLSEEPIPTPRLVVGTGCSEHAQERMLTTSEWIQFFEQRLKTLPVSEVLFLGTQEERKSVNIIIEGASKICPGLSFKNLCGELALGSSVRELSTASWFWGIDSSLIHFARLLNISSVSFWGPSSPTSRLRPIPQLQEEVFWKNPLCSPCVHVAETPPCRGNNLCMKAHFTEVSEQEFRKNIMHLP